MTSALQGGEFRSGMMSAGFAEMFGGSKTVQDMGRVQQGIARVLIGGSASVIAGGEFRDGARTAAFAYLFNELRHTDEAAPYVKQLRDGSPLAAEILDGMAADPTTKYRISVGPVQEICGGGCTELVPGPQPSLWDRLLGRTNTQLTVSMRIDPAGAEPLRALAHELGHGYTYLKGGYTGYRINYDQAVVIENTIARQLNPNAYIRPISSHGRWYQ